MPRGKAKTEVPTSMPEVVQKGMEMLQNLTPFNGPMKLPSGGLDGVIVGMELQLTTLKQAAMGLEKMIDAVKWQRDFMNQFKP